MQAVVCGLTDGRTSGWAWGWKEGGRRGGGGAAAARTNSTILHWKFFTGLIAGLPTLSSTKPGCTLPFGVFTLPCTNPVNIDT